MQRCTHPPAEAPHLPLSAAVIPTRLWRYAARWACTASSVLTSVYGLTTMPGPARRGPRNATEATVSTRTGPVDWRTAMPWASRAMTFHRL